MQSCVYFYYFCMLKYTNLRKKEMKFNRKNIYLKPEIYIEEFDDADEEFMAASPNGFVSEDTGNSGEDWEGNEEAKKSTFSPLELNWDDDNE